MKTIIQTTVLLLSIGASLLFANPIELNTDRPGNDYKNLGNLRDASVCQRKCQEEDRCVAWTFVKPNTIQGPKSQCYLKHSVPNKMHNTATISGLINRSAVGIERNTDRPGNDYKNLGNLRDASVCQRKCQEEDRCVAWTFVRKNTIQGPMSQCYLKDVVPNKIHNTATLSGLINRSVQQQNSNIPTTDEIKRYIAQHGNDIFFVKKGAVGVFAEVHYIALDAILGTSIRDKIYRASLKDEDCTNKDKLQDCELKKIVDMVKENGSLKLYISIKNNVGGIANERASAMKEYLAWYGLTPGSGYHVQKVSKNDKKKREWLSKNNHLWIRVAPKRN